MPTGEAAAAATVAGVVLLNLVAEAGRLGFRKDAVPSLSRPVLDAFWNFLRARDSAGYCVSQMFGLALSLAMISVEIQHAKVM